MCASVGRLRSAKRASWLPSPASSHPSIRLFILLTLAAKLSGKCTLPQAATHLEAPQLTGGSPSRSDRLRQRISSAASSEDSFVGGARVGVEP